MQKHGRGNEPGTTVWDFREVTTRPTWLNETIKKFKEYAIRKFSNLLHFSVVVKKVDRRDDNVATAATPPWISSNALVSNKLLGCQCMYLNTY